MYVILRLLASAVGYAALFVATHSPVVPLVFLCGVVFILAIFALCVTD